MVPGVPVAPVYGAPPVPVQPLHPPRPVLCCNGSTFFAVAAMGVAIYLALVGGGLSAAFLSAVILKGVKLI